MTDPSPELVRLLELRRWMRGLGACFHCSLTFSIAAVEREAGREFKAEPAPHPKAAATGWQKASCDELVRAHWKDRPKKEAT